MFKVEKERVVNLEFYRVQAGEYRSNNERFNIIASGYRRWRVSDNLVLNSDRSKYTSSLDEAKKTALKWYEEEFEHKSVS